MFTAVKNKNNIKYHNNNKQEMTPVSAGIGVAARVGSAIAKLVVQTGRITARHVNVLTVHSHGVLLTRGPHLALT